jgi:hypothetical protein
MTSHPTFQMGKQHQVARRGARIEGVINIKVIGNDGGRVFPESPRRLVAKCPVDKRGLIVFKDRVAPEVRQTPEVLELLTLEDVIERKFVDLDLIEKNVVKFATRRDNGNV